MPHPEQIREASRLVELRGGVGLGVGRHQHCMVADRVPGRAGQKRRVHAARKGHEDAAHLADDPEEPLLLRRE